MNKLIKLSVVYLIFLCVGCSEDPVPESPQYYRVFTGQNKKTWKITKLVWTGEGKSDVSLSFSSCYRDDTYTFYANKDNLYEVNGGTSKCTADEASPLVSDRWSFVNGSATLTAILPLFSDSSLPFFVTKATSNEMTLEIYIDQDNIYSYQVTMQSVSEE